jgi:hypothetical protein
MAQDNNNSIINPVNCKKCLELKPLVHHFTGSLFPDEYAGLVRCNICSRLAKKEDVQNLLDDQRNT